MSDSLSKPSLRTTDAGGPFSRRDFLWNSGGGLGGIALAWMMNRDSAKASQAKGFTIGQPHHRPRARRVVQVFCAGGVSHLETFDHKPELEKMHGKSLE